MQVALREEEFILEPDIEPRTPLEKWLEEAIQDQARLTATYQNKVFVAVVPRQESELVETLKNCLERAMANETFPTDGPTDREADEKVSHLEIFPSRTQAALILRGLLDLATVNQMCLTLSYLKKLFIVVVPLGKEELMEEIEDWIDSANIDDVHQEGGQPIPWEQIKRELGL
jgi:hypothetical protein